MQQPTTMSSTRFKRLVLRLSFGVSVMCGLFGCARQDDSRRDADAANPGAKTNATASGTTSVVESGFLPEAARATRIARAYDRGIEAARRGDETAFVEACRRLRALRAMPEALALASGANASDAEKAVSRGMALDSRAEQASRKRDENPKTPTRNDTPDNGESDNGESGNGIFGDSESGSGAMNEGSARGEADEVGGATPDALRVAAALEYRRALQLSPRFDSPDPDKLNTLAYFLAERGTSESDFAIGEDLSRRAVAMLDEAISQGASRGYRTERWKLSRAVTRDTLAWALFRRGHLEAALREQQSAVRESDEAWRAIKPLLPPETALDENDMGRADLLFHLGEILRALGRTSEARAQFQSALKADPKHLQSRNALRALSE